MMMRAHMSFHTCLCLTSSISHNTSSVFNNNNKVSDEDGEVHVSVLF